MNILYLLAGIEVVFAVLCSMPMLAHIRNGNAEGAAIWAFAVGAAFICACVLLMMRWILK